MILIIGASGALGIPIIKELASRGVKLRALTSSDTSSDNLKSLGVTETVIGDWADASALAQAMKGVSSVCYIPARFKENELEIGKGVVDAARIEGVDHFCFCSAFQSQIEELGHHWKKLRLEEYLISSDLMCTVVKPAMFMQNLRVEWSRIVDEGIYARPYSPDSPMNVVDTDDLGLAIANILTDRALWGASYELCGSATLSHNEMAQIISDELGRPVKAVHRDIDEWKAWATDKGWSDYAMEHYVRMCAHYDAHGFKFGNDVTLRALIGQPATDFREFVKKFIKFQAG